MRALAHNEVEAVSGGTYKNSDDPLSPEPYNPMPVPLGGPFMGTFNAGDSVNNTFEGTRSPDGTTIVVLANQQGLETSLLGLPGGSGILGRVIVGGIKYLLGGAINASGGTTYCCYLEP
jgi:hypothetical protein